MPACESMPSRRPAQRGMSLIELMVGILVASVISLAAVVSAQLFMGRQRQSIDVGSAGGNAMTGMAAIEYEAAHAGIGFFAGGAPLCQAMNLSVGATAFKTNAFLSPLNITVAGNATTLDIAYASALEAAAPSPLSAATASDATSVSTSSYLPVSVGQQVMLVPAAGSALPCTVRTATSVVPATDTAPEGLGTDGSGANNQFAFAPVAYDTTGFVTKLGALQWSRFRLSGTDLLMERPLSGQQAAMTHNVVAFRAQYGIGDGTSNTLAGWQDAAGAYASLDIAHMPLVRALRVGLVVRSDMPQKKVGGQCNATTAAPTLFGAAVALTDPDWRCYRYRLSTVTVPLRNFIMGSDT
ncbi:MAG: PilW family protein [Burkholderiaceae bacterium]